MAGHPTLSNRPFPPSRPDTSGAKILRMKFLRTVLVATGVCCLVAGASADRKPATVVPGSNIGRVFLGNTVAQVRKELGAPDRSLKLSNGLADDLFRAKSTRVTPDGQTVRDTLEVLYQGGKVVQIEATSPKWITAKGLSVLSNLRFLDQSLHPKKFLTYGYDLDESGYVKYYVDQTSTGLAFESPGMQDSWEWSAGSATIIVHRRNFPVIPDQGGKLEKSSNKIEVG